MTLPTIALGVHGWTLRPWRDGDAVALARHADNPKVWRNMSDGFPHPYTLRIAEHWVRAGQIELGGDHWAIAFEDSAVGGCGIAQDSAQFRCNVEIGYWLAQAWGGHGIATRVARALTEQAFTNPEITRVYAPVHADNLASMRVLEKCGFVREGVLRKSAIKAGRVIDRVQYAVYRDSAEA